jgi:hypothetical protein
MDLTILSLGIILEDICWIVLVFRNLYGHLVLENANDNPSVIYEFLKGPAFAGAQNLHEGGGNNNNNKSVTD